MSRFIKSADRFQSILFPETLDDYIEEENSVRISGQNGDCVKKLTSI